MIKIISDSWTIFLHTWLGSKLGSLVRLEVKTTVEVKITTTSRKF